MEITPNTAAAPVEQDKDAVIAAGIVETYLEVALSKLRQLYWCGITVGDIVWSLISMIRSWQFVAVMTDTMALPLAWMAVWSPLANVLSLNTAHWGAPHAVEFIALVGVAHVAMLILVGLSTHRFTKDARALLSAALRNGSTETATKWFSMRHIRYATVLSLSTALTVLHIPITRHCIALISCHPSLTCIHDCTSANHKTLLVVAWITLVTITLGFPALCCYSTWVVYDQYQGFLTTSEKKRSSYWPVFVDILSQGRLPGGLSRSIHYGAVFIEPGRLCVDAVLVSTLLLMSTTTTSSGEGVQLLVATCIVSVFVLVFVVWTVVWRRRVFRQALVNTTMFVSLMYIVVMLILRGVQLLSRAGEGVANAMIFTSACFLAAQLILVGMTIGAKVLQKDTAQLGGGIEEHEAISPVLDGTAAAAAAAAPTSGGLAPASTAGKPVRRGSMGGNTLKGIGLVRKKLSLKDFLQRNPAPQASRRGSVAPPVVLRLHDGSDGEALVEGV